MYGAGLVDIIGEPVRILNQCFTVVITKNMLVVKICYHWIVLLM